MYPIAQIVIPDTKSGYYGGTPDALATVRKFGVIAPSTNTIVEYDFWKMLMKVSGTRGVASAVHRSAFARCCRRITWRASGCTKATS